MQPGKRRLGLGGVWHLDKAQAPRPAGVSIHHNLDARHPPIGVKEMREFFFCSRAAQIPDKDMPVCLMLGHSMYRNL